MFSFPGILALVIFFFVRPQEFIPVLAELPLLYIFTAFAVFGIVIDLKLRLVPPRLTPQLPWVLLFFTWTLASAAMKHDEPVTAVFEIAILFVWYFLISHALQSFHSFRAMTWIILALTLFLSAVGLHQYFADTGCITLEPGASHSVAVGVADGRPCRVRKDCEGPGAEPGQEYLCEKIGVFGTNSIGGRVRYRGELHDPNEFALIIAVSLPFALALFSIQRSKRRLAALLLAIACGVLCVVFTSSRGGMLALVVAVGVYFVRRFRFAGLAVAGGLASALLVVASATRADVSDSANERIECMREGMTMFRYHPFFGVGFDQFIEHHYLTAHNSVVLVAAELGIIGLFLWVAVIYVSMKIPIKAYLEHPDQPQVRHWAIAMIAALAAMLTGSFFLSFSYRYMLWCYLALCGAFYCATKVRNPGWKLRIGFGDILMMGLISVGLVAVVYTFVRVMPH
jgi:ABC-type amino acid transport system permease subunit